MSDPRVPSETLADIADPTTSDEEAHAWMAAHPRQAAELAAARNGRLLVEQLRDVRLPAPEHFERRVMRRVHGHTAVNELLHLNLVGSGRATLELLGVLFSFVPPPTQEPSSR